MRSVREWVVSYRLPSGAVARRIFHTVSRRDAVAAFRCYHNEPIVTAVTAASLAR